MRLESPFTEVKKSQQTVYKAVNDVARYKEFMPDAVGSFRTGEDFGMPWFAFTIGGMPEIKLVRDTAEPYSKVSFSTPMGAKISLAVDIKYVTDDISSVKVSIDADVNPMLRMRVERPLKKFLGDVSDKIRMVE